MHYTKLKQVVFSLSQKYTVSVNSSDNQFKKCPICNVKNGVSLKKRLAHFCLQKE